MNNDMNTEIETLNHFINCDRISTIIQHRSTYAVKLQFEGRNSTSYHDNTSWTIPVHIQMTYALAFGLASSTLTQSHNNWIFVNNR